MFVLILFGFLAGIVTVLSPCILPVLPIVLSGTLTGDRKRPLGIILGFIISFTFFTLFLTAIVRLTGLPSDALRTIAIVVIFFFGLTLIIPRTQVWMEKLFSRLASIHPAAQNNSGFVSGILVGLSLGLLWAPCVGPILASVIALAATSTVTAISIFVTLAYAIGTAIPMLAIMYGGRSLLQRFSWITNHTTGIQKAFGIFMIATAVILFFNVDRQFQTIILTAFPQYGAGLTQIEQNKAVQDQLKLIGGKSGQQTDFSGSQTSALPNMGPVSDFVGITKWLIPQSDGTFSNTPLTMQDLRGNVVLVDFWTYTCINCIRTLPFVTKWYDKYHDKGFVVVGVHTPEFEFEKITSNVEGAIKQYGIHYPVAQDNDYATWNAYHNQYWPAEYLIDANGNVRHVHFGEGEYDQTEKAIQDLLKEKGATVASGLIKASDQTPRESLTPETYIGSSRRERFGSPEIVTNGDQTLSFPKDLSNDNLALQGQWNIEDEMATAGKGSQLEFKFHAQKVYLVITPKDKTDKVKVFLDGKPISSAQAGSDVKDGYVQLDMQRLYNLVHLDSGDGYHILRLDFQTGGDALYAFTFG